MEPSYNDSFGQGDSGVSGTGVISSGDAGGVAPATPGSSRSDIILSSSDSGGGNGGKRRFLVVIVVLLFLVAIGVGVAMWLMGGGDDDFGDVSNGDIKEKFNEYANYVLLGENSTNDFKYDEIIDIIPYFGRIDISELEQYLEAAEQKFGVFSNAYSAEFGPSDISKLDDYYRGLVWVQGLSDSEILGDSIKVTSEYLQRYIDAKKKYIVIMEQVSENAINGGCANVEGCYELSESEIIGITESVAEMNFVIARMFNEATGVFEDVYNIIYGEEAL